MGMIDIDLKGEMDIYSDNSLRDKIFRLYTEADDPQLKDFQIGHLAFMVGEGIDPNAIRKMGSSITQYNEAIKVIDASAGNIKAMKNYEDMKAILNGCKLYTEAVKKSKYLEETMNLMELLEENATHFQKAYKKQYSMFAKTVYRGLVMSLVVECSALSITFVAVQADAKVDMDTYIDKTAGWKDLFRRTADVINDKDMKKLIAGAGIELKAEAVDYYATSIANNATMYSEVSLQDVAFLFKLGVAKLAYKICGLFRFLIYMVLVGKYSLEARLAEMKNVMAYSQKDLSAKMKDDDEKFMNTLVDIRVDDIKTGGDAEKDVSSIKIKEVEDGKFSL